MDSATLIAKLDAAEVPGGPIYSIEQAFNDPQAKHMQLDADRDRDATARK